MTALASPPFHQQTLLFDADDTLWENNVYFEQVIAAFISHLDHKVHTPEEVREHLNRVEHATIAAHGYGTQSFRRSLIVCFEELSGTGITAEDHGKLVAFAESIADHEIELLPGVEETLKQLATRHRLILVTKGNVEEQTDKLERSGLAPLFAHVEIPREKTSATYTELAGRLGCARRATWMIGNSPKSDINPALAAGLNAIFIPHDFTWVLEHATVACAPPGQSLLQLPGFASLLDYF